MERDNGANLVVDLDQDVKVEKTATPLKRYVTVIVNRKDGNASKWTCNFGCKKEPYTGTYSRVRAHLIGLQPGQKSQGVQLCPKVTKEEREIMKKEEDEAVQIFGARSKVPPSIIPTIPPKASTVAGKRNVEKQMFKKVASSDVDAVIASFLYTNGISFNVARSPFWDDMVRAINEAPKGYRPPSAEKIRTTLLDQEKNKIDKALMPLKEEWATYGVSIVSDGWTNIKNRTLINVMAVSSGRAMFITGIDSSGDEKSGEYIAEVLFKAIENVGTYNVVQVLTDDASACQSAGRIVEAKYPHIFWSGCMAHTLSLLMKDITKSRHPSMDFVRDTYERAKSIVKFIKNHNSVLYIFQTFPALDVIQVKKTRFGHHYLTLERISRLKNALTGMVLSEEWEKSVSGSSRSNVQHEDVERTILDDNFWKKTRAILSFAKPIWEVIRFCDSDRAVVGEVYQMMEDMLESIKNELSNSDDIGIYHVVEGFVLQRWKKMNLPLHSLAYVLTPFYYSKAWLKSSGPGKERRKKPHADHCVGSLYLDAVDRIVKDPREQKLVRAQLSDFVSNKGIFGRPQAINDRESLSAIQWWDLYGVPAAELYSVAVQVLSQSVNSSCAERALSTYGYIHSVKRNKLNADRAESLVYVHNNHRLLSRYREDYEVSYQNWDSFIDDDNLDNDMEAIEEREHRLLHEALGSFGGRPSFAGSNFPTQGSTHESSLVQGQSRQEIVRCKRKHRE